MHPFLCSLFDQFINTTFTQVWSSNPGGSRFFFLWFPKKNNELTKGCILMGKKKFRVFKLPDKNSSHFESFSMPNKTMFKFTSFHSIFFQNWNSVQQFFTLVPEKNPFFYPRCYFFPSCYIFCLGWVFYDIWNPCVHALLLLVFYAKKVSTPFAPYEIHNFTATYIGCTSSFCLLTHRFCKIFTMLTTKKSLNST